jgi:polysaccharide pyruvyl transferase WcaK-like protein
MFPWIKAAEDAVVVGDIRGGDSFSDIYGMERFLTGFLMAWSVILVKGSMVQYPQTYGPYRSKLAKLLAGYLLKESNVIMARDETSRRVAQDLTGNRKDVILCPDVAFVLDALPPQSLAVNPPAEGIEIPAGVIGLNVNGLMYNGGYTRDNMFGLKLDYPRMLPVLIEKLLEVHEGELWFVPHAFAESGNVESDPDACMKVRESLPEQLRSRTRIISAEYDCHELKWIIGQLDFFIGSRMHSCIAALSQGVPCVGIAYSRKFEGVFHTVGMEEWVIDGRSLTEEEAVLRILSLYLKRVEVRQGLKASAQEAAKRLRETFEGLFSASK